MIGMSGVRPPLSKIKPLTEMEKPTTVGELRSFVGSVNFLRDFVKDFSSLVAPIEAILRNKDISTKRAGNKTIPDKSRTTPSRLSSALWYLHRCSCRRIGSCSSTSTQLLAKEPQERSVLTRLVENRHVAIGFGRHRWTLPESTRAPTDGEIRAVLSWLDHSRTYLQHRPFTFVTDFSAITSLFTSHHLSPTMYRIVEVTMTLQWRKGTEYTVPGALTHVPHKAPAGPPIDRSFPDDNTSPTDGSHEPMGQVINGVPLQGILRRHGRAPPRSSQDAGRYAGTPRCLASSVGSDGGDQRGRTASTTRPGTASRT